MYKRFIVGNAWEGGRDRAGLVCEPSDCDAGVTPAKGKEEGSELGQREP